MTATRKFPTLALVILILGLVAVVSVAVVFLFSPAARPPSNVTSSEQAKQIGEQYMTGESPGLKVKEIMEFSNNFYVIAQEESTEVNAFELLVDRDTGSVGPEPGPNIMWNTKYGPMSGYRGAPTANMPVSASKALEYAQNWLDANMPGAMVEEPETFYGYYTIDISRNDDTYGMLSVNGYSGEVWYHTWHGQFIRMVEYD